MQAFVLCKIPRYLVGSVFSTHLQILSLTLHFSLLNSGCGLTVNCLTFFFYIFHLVATNESRPGKRYTLNYDIILPLQF